MNTVTLHFICGKMAAGKSTFARQLALSEHIVALLRGGVSVILDFPGNTRNQRRWFRQLIDRAQPAHELHYLDVSDDVCKAQLRERSKALPPGSPFTTDAEFEVITRYFQPPSIEEGFNVVAAPPPE
jgi:predicted kinase